MKFLYMIVIVGMFHQGVTIFGPIWSYESDIRKNKHWKSFETYEPCSFDYANNIITQFVTIGYDFWSIKVSKGGHAHLIHFQMVHFWCRFKRNTW